MHKKFLPPSQTKLSKTLDNMANEKPIEKSGFVTTSQDKTLYFKTKSFRFRQADYENFIKLVKEINNNADRKFYSESEVVRGVINYIADNMDVSLKKITAYIKISS